MNHSPGILTDVFERITDAFVALDTEWRFAYMNKRAGEILGVDPSAMMGKNIWQVLPEAVDQPFYKAYNQAMQQQQYIHVQEYYAPYDRWFENHIYPSPEGLSVFFRDITEQKQTEEYLKRSEEKQRTILQSLLDYVLILNAEGEIQYINHIVPGLTEVEIIGSNWLRLVHEEDHLKVKEAIELTLSSRMFSEIQVRSIGPGKIKTWFNTKIFPMPDVFKREVLLVATDITEQKKAEEVIIKSEEQYRDLVENISDLICTHDLDGRILSMNRAAEKIIGFKFDPQQNFNVKDILTTGTEIKFDSYIAELQKTGRSYNVIKVKMRSGEIRIWQCDSSLKITDGKPPIVRGYARDITERKKAEQAIKKSEEKYRTLVEQASDAIFIADTNGRFVTVNTSACKLAQYSEKELLQMSIYDFAILEDIQKNPFHFDELRQGKTVITERVMKGKDAMEQNVEITAKMLSDGRFLAFVKDITERKKAAEAINQLNLDLELRVKERTAELEQTNIELEEINDLFVGREARIIELKEELEALKNKPRFQ